MKNRGSIELLREEVRQVQRRHPQLSDDNAFCLWFAHAYLTDDEETAMRCLLGGPRDVGVDALYVDPDAKHVYVIQSKYRTGATAAPEHRNDVLGLLHLGEDLQGDAKAFSARLSNADDPVRHRLQEARRRIAKDHFRLCLVYVTTGSVSEGIIDEANQRTRDESDFVALQRKDVLRTLVDYLDGAAPPVPLLDLPIERDTFLRRFDSDLGIESWVFSMLANDVARLYREAGIRLFARNIRGFLGAATDINTGMAYTLRREPRHFWYYNNGITIACDSAQTVGKDGKTRLRVAHAQIINGQQTTRMLSEAPSRAASVLVRVMRIPRTPEEGGSAYERLVSRIVRATNWQNEIRPSDLVSNDAEQVRLEREMRKLGYLYLRKRQSKGEAKRLSTFKPKATIKKFEMAQYVAACLMDPFEVRAGKERLFESELYPKVFGGWPMNQYLTKYCVGRVVSSGSRGDASRAYAKWVVLHFLWSQLATTLFASSRRDIFIRACEQENWSGRALQYLRRAIDSVFIAAGRFYRTNRRVDGRKLDESTFFKRRGLHERFEGYWERRDNRQRRRFRRAITAFESCLEGYDS